MCHVSVLRSAYCCYFKQRPARSKSELMRFREFAPGCRSLSEAPVCTLCQGYIDAGFAEPSTLTRKTDEERSETLSQDVLVFPGGGLWLATAHEDGGAEHATGLDGRP
jgi:hypothetical protein